MIEITANSREFRKAKIWFDTDGPGAHLRLQQVAGIISTKKYFNALENEFNCTVNAIPNIYGVNLIRSFIFENDADATLFLLRWA